MSLSKGQRWTQSDHGSRARYNRGCRCKPCKEAARLYLARYRRQGATFMDCSDAIDLIGEILHASK